MGAKMRTTISLPKIFLLFLTGLAAGGMQAALGQANGGYDELLRLFGDWREFESPDRVLPAAPP